MKRLIISVLLLCLIFGFCAFSYSFIQKKVAELDAELALCIEYINEENYGDAKEKIDDSSVFWQKNQGKFKMLVEGAFCETVENCLDSIRFCFEEKEYTQAKNSVNECRNALRQILENERLSIEVVL